MTFPSDQNKRFSSETVKCTKQFVRHFDYRETSSKETQNDERFAGYLKKGK